ncbi:MAG: hypothetical protein M1838_001552 [Thelocarpon superellum]|nr:MAG: hypothetical protein M1838_001552 [Thelocarpon superellum]
MAESLAAGAVPPEADGGTRVPHNTPFLDVDDELGRFLAPTPDPISTHQSDRPFLEVLCGPLLNYHGMRDVPKKATIWRGSALVVTASNGIQPTLRLARATEGVEENSRGRKLRATKLYADPRKTFWRFDLEVPLSEAEARWEYNLPDARYRHEQHTPADARRSFFVPAQDQSMRIMFHSCNGFSVGTDEEAYSGPALWQDVVRVHEKKPFHCMIGGGDQIYNDGVRVTGPLAAWTSIKNPKRRRDYAFNEDLRARCDQFYYNNYRRWYATESFATANARIPQINIWDDHDLIDGFGSYTDHFMKCHVFRGIGGVAFKYYTLFQHHAPPPVSTFTSDAPQTMKSQGLTGAGPDPVQLKDAFVLQGAPDDPSWIIGGRPGPYVEERSRSLYMQLGKRMAFVGIDARTERTRHQVNYLDTYDRIFGRVHDELGRKAGEIKHLIVLLGIPIAYPRLIWLENILRSPIIGPIRFLSKRFGFASGLFNEFDGAVDLLDDLDDHYTARQHKKERKELMLRLQAVAAQHGVRITILGGDVHLAALGRFYSKPGLMIPTEQDHRYMVNVISSAITNHPPPRAVANMLARRNKIHHLDAQTDETLMNLFDREPFQQENGMLQNHTTMPSRNYAILTESGSFDSTPTAGSNGSNGDHANGHADGPPEGPSALDVATGKDGHSPLHRGEKNAGTTHPAASGVEPSNTFGPHGLDVAYRIEINHSDRRGLTEGYGLSIPSLSPAKS